jgi:hypothetical protein
MKPQSHRRAMIRSLDLARSTQWSPYLNCGVINPDFAEFAGKLSDALFDTFFQDTQKHLEGL